MGSGRDIVGSRIIFFKAFVAKLYTFENVIYKSYQIHPNIVKNYNIKLFFKCQSRIFSQIYSFLVIKNQWKMDDFVLY